jgi:hypothetical protein
MDRAIAPNEAAVVRWLLDHAPVGDVTACRIHPVEELRVVKGCDCGCASLDFQPHAWGGAGEIVLLEIYDCHPGASHGFPEISNLWSFKEGGRWSFKEGGRDLQ